MVDCRRVWLKLLLVPLAAAAGSVAFAPVKAGVHLQRASTRASSAVARAGLRSGSAARHHFRQGVRMSLFPDLFGAMRGGGGSSTAPTGPLAVFPSAFHDAAPSWDQLDEMVKATEHGKRLHEEQRERSAGSGPSHCKNKLRLFGKSEDEVRVVLYRDHAAWCPYCQKVWLLLEEKRMPYRIEHINMRSYGDKPDWFLKKNPSGMLPVVEIDGQMMSDSIRIMQVLDSLDDTVPMLPRGDKGALGRANELMQMERELFSAWCSFVFQPGGFGQKSFEKTLDRVDKALLETDGPWFLGGDTPSIVDLQYVTHVERMAPSALYWKGFTVRGGAAEKRWPGLHRWLAAFEDRQPYVATKSDYYTHIMDIPPQYGPGQGVAEAEALAKQLDGREGWQLPLPALSADAPEPVLDKPLVRIADGDARVEAALCLIGNHKNIARFCARAAGSEVGQWRQQGGGSKSALADPYAKPKDEVVPDLDACLRHVAHALLAGPEVAAQKVVKPEVDSRVQQECLGYLRQRISVPRDMSYPAARQLRAHLSWGMDQIK